MKRLMLLLLTGLLGMTSVSCRDQRHDPVVDRTDPTMHGMLLMAEGAGAYFYQHGEFPDSLDQFLRLIKVPDDVTLRRVDVDRVLFQIDGAAHSATYRSVKQYPSTTIRGELRHQVLGFEIYDDRTMIDHLFHAVEGRFDHQGRIVVIVH